MAVDTALKRASSAQMLLMSLQSPPLPSGAFTVFVRQAIAHTYAGIQSLFTGVSILRQMMMHHGG
jgi:hypothetical protein